MLIEKEIGPRMCLRYSLVKDKLLSSGQLETVPCVNCFDKAVGLPLPLEQR